MKQVLVSLLLLVIAARCVESLRSQRVRQPRFLKEDKNTDEETEEPSFAPTLVPTVSPSLSPVATSAPVGIALTSFPTPDQPTPAEPTLAPVVPATEAPSGSPVTPLIRALLYDFNVTIEGSVLTDTRAAADGIEDYLETMPFDNLQAVELTHQALSLEGRRYLQSTGTILLVMTGEAVFEGKPPSNLLETQTQFLDDTEAVEDAINDEVDEPIQVTAIAMDQSSTEEREISSDDNTALIAGVSAAGAVLILGIAFIWYRRSDAYLDKLPPPPPPPIEILDAIDETEVVLQKPRTVKDLLPDEERLGPIVQLTTAGTIVSMEDDEVQEVSLDNRAIQLPKVDNGENKTQKIAPLAVKEGVVAASPPVNQGPIVSMDGAIEIQPSESLDSMDGDRSTDKVQMSSKWLSPGTLPQSKEDYHSDNESQFTYGDIDHHSLEGDSVYTSPNSMIGSDPGAVAASQFDPYGGYSGMDVDDEGRLVSQAHTMSPNTLKTSMKSSLLNRGDDEGSQPSDEAEDEVGRDLDGFAAQLENARIS